jgi:predicted transposase YdaD
VRFADIVPPPEEVEHAHSVGGDSEHERARGEQEEKEKENGEGEGSTGPGPTIEDLHALRVRLETLLQQAGLQVHLNLE